MAAKKDIVLQEIETGGKEPPCPFCGIPRVKRSDYIRCCNCGINWIDGEALDHDPRAQRLKIFLDNIQSTATVKKKEPDASPQRFR